MSFSVELRDVAQAGHVVSWSPCAFAFPGLEVKRSGGRLGDLARGTGWPRTWPARVSNRFRIRSNSAGEFRLLPAGKASLLADGLQALVPCEEFQRQGLELIEHVAEEFAELVLSCTKFVQRSVRRLDARGSCRSTDTATRLMSESCSAAAPTAW